MKPKRVTRKFLKTQKRNMHLEYVTRLANGKDTAISNSVEYVVCGHD